MYACDEGCDLGMIYISLVDKVRNELHWRVNPTTLRRTKL